MNLIPTQPNSTWSIDQLRKHFGMIPAERILLEPAPGTATVADAYRLNEQGPHRCELVDGVLVEKAMGDEESELALWIGHMIYNYLEEHNLGKLLGEAGFLELMPGLLRAADVAFIAWERYPLNPPPYAGVAPDLAVEVISESNTEKELERKRRDYFSCGASLVWQVDPKTRTVEVYTSVKKCKVLGTKDTLDGGAVLPGFKLKVAKLFSPPQRPRR